MDFAAAFRHTTYSPTLLLLLAIGGAIGVVLITWRTRFVVGRCVAVAVTAALVLAAGEHIPLVGYLAPRTFCFGDIGPIHLIAFVLPIVALTVGHRCGRGRQAG